MSAREVSFRCIRCGRNYDAAQDHFGCPACAEEGVAVNLEVAYAQPVRVQPRDGIRGLWRYDGALPLEREDGVELVEVEEQESYALELEHLGSRRAGRDPLLLASDAVSQARAITALYESADRRVAVEPARQDDGLSARPRTNRRVRVDSATDAAARACPTRCS